MRSNFVLFACTPVSAPHSSVFARLACRGERPLAHHGRPAGRPYNRNHLPLNLLQVSKKDMLKVEELSVFYGDYQAVKGISFEVGRGELVTFIGANGAGKTSTIRAILGLVERVKGRIWFDGRDMSQAPSHVRVKEGMRMIPEGRKIFPELTVVQNLRIGAYFIKMLPGWSRTANGSTACFRFWRKERISWAGPFPAESSRCWPSAGP